MYPSMHWDRPPRQASPWVDTPLGRHPPAQADPLRETPPGQMTPWADTPTAATAVDGTHPTGMHSC